MKNSFIQESNISNLTYLTKDEFFLLNRLTNIIDDLEAYLMTPLSVLGIVLNLISFFIFKNNRFNSIPLYGYLKIYTINSSVICLINSTYFLISTSTFFSIVYAYEMQFYSCYIYTPVF